MIKYLIGCYLIMVATVWFNYKIILTQQAWDDQNWHKAQLIQWITIYSSMLFIIWDFNALLILVAFALTYPFLYDGLLNRLRGRQWFDSGDEDFGRKFSFSKNTKIAFFIIGVFLWLITVLK